MLRTHFVDWNACRLMYLIRATDRTNHSYLALAYLPLRRCVCFKRCETHAIVSFLFFLLFCYFQNCWCNSANCDKFFKFSPKIACKHLLLLFYIFSCHKLIVSLYHSWVCLFFLCFFRQPLVNANKCIDKSNLSRLNLLQFDKKKRERNLYMKSTKALKCDAFSRTAMCTRLMNRCSISSELGKYSRQEHSKIINEHNNSSTVIVIVIILVRKID